MDAKSLAKSKRAHSQHLKKTHQNPKLKAPSPTTTIAAPADANSKKPLTKQTREKSRQFSSALPTNWDRYDEEFNSDSEVAGTNRSSDVVVPKSKGADFAHLISEAQSQLESQSSLNSDIFASIDDVMPHFNQGVSSMLSVRGNSILSWIGDDNFIVDDDSTTGHEASFLSMDLHSLAAQLAKSDISKRLFIEEDILPPELRADVSHETISQESEKAETCASGADIHCPDKVAFLGHADVESEAAHSTITRRGNSVPDFPHEGAQLINPVKDISMPLEQTDLREVDSVTQFNMNAVADLEKKTSAFEALAAESELDMLLNSFGETKLLDPYGISKNGTNKKLSNGMQQPYDSTSLLEGRPSVYGSPQPFGQGFNLSKRVITVDLDDTINNLLEETSNLENHSNSVLRREQKDVPSVIPSLASKNVHVTVDLDDTIDNLLEETSHLTNHSDAMLRRERKDVPSVIPSSASHSTKVLDDFDSWLDTI